MWNLRHSWSLLLVLGLGTGISDGQTCETIVFWTQNSHSWTRMRGICGNPAEWVENGQHKYVGSEPARDQRYYAVAHDDARNYVYWSDMTRKTIYRQNMNSSLFERRIDDVETIFTGPENITSMAVDWLSGAIYWTDDYNNRIAVTAAASSGQKHVHSVLFSSFIDLPVGIAVMPDWGKLYWMDAGREYKIETSTTTGENREILLGSEVGKGLCLTLDHQEAALYWVVAEGWTDTVVKKYSLVTFSATIETIIYLPQGLQQQVSSIATFQNYIFLANRAEYGMDVYHKHTGDSKTKYIIDAIPNHLAIAGTTKPTHPECNQLKCDHICLTIDTQSAKCICGIGYYINPDGKTCAKASSNPKYIYSRGEQIWSSDAKIDPLVLHGVSLNESVVVSNMQQVQALGFDFEVDHLFWADATMDVIYYGPSSGYSITELTVNTRHIEGMSVDWQTHTLYWADHQLQHIMCSQWDGRYHRVVLENTGYIRGLAVDPIHGMMYWTLDDGQRSIMTSRLDGTGVRTLVTGDINKPQGIAVDTRQGRLYWVDSSYNKVSSVTLGGESRIQVFDRQYYSMYDVTIFEGYVTWTEEFDHLRFGHGRTKEYISNIQHHSNDYWDSSRRNYDVVTFSNYLQPKVPGPCDIDNGGCDHHCVATPPGDTASLQTTATCTCAIGYTLSSDKKSCSSDLLNGDFIMFADPYHKQIYQLGFDTTATVQGVPVDRLDFPTSMDIDSEDGRVYWIDKNSRKIKSASIYGADIKTHWDFADDSTPERLVVDPATKHAYYTDSERGHIVNIYLDKKSQSMTFQGFSSPNGIALDTTNGYIYYTEFDKVGRLKTDGSGKEDLVTGLYRPTDVTLWKDEPGVIYYNEMDMGRIIKYNVDSKTSRVIFDDTERLVYSLATNGAHVYFSCWNEKAVNRIPYDNDGQQNHIKRRSLADTEVMDQPVFARIYDIKAFTGIVIPPPVPADFPVVPVAAAAAGALFLALLVGFLLCCCLRKKPKKAAATDPENHTYANGDVERDYANFDNGTMFDTPNNHEAHTNPAFDEPNGHVSNGHANGSANPVPDTEIPEPPPAPPLPAAGIPTLLASAPTAKKVKRKKTKEMDLPKNDPDFVLSENQKVATVINRLANRLRNRLSTIRWHGDDRKSGGGKRHSQEDKANETENFDGANVGMGPQQRKDVPKKKYTYEPQLHRPPRGYAPASHSVPRPVKTTWGRAKHNKYLNKPPQ